MNLRTCVMPSGKFIFGLHRPVYRASNFREHDGIAALGRNAEGADVLNARNFPAADIEVEAGDLIYEIPNPFPFRGTTFLCRSWADTRADDPCRIRHLQEAAPVSMTDSLTALLGGKCCSARQIEAAFRALPKPVLLTLASTSTDPRDLSLLAAISSDFVRTADSETPFGLLYKEIQGHLRPVIHNHDLFETLVNNPYLPDTLKEIMVLRPGVQGDSEIMGEYGADGDKTHIFEYLRQNSYIPWGHYAANMAHDAVRYRIQDLSDKDMQGLRHLYYQRSFSRLAELLGLPLPNRRKALNADELEKLRLGILAALQNRGKESHPAFTATLWGWNFGFDFAASGYRLHASHQQIHQQFAMLPAEVEAWHNGRDSAGFSMPAYSCGDMVTQFCRDYLQQTGENFFNAYIRAIRGNRRMDERQNENQSLVVYEDEKVMLFVPKAQTSQWELQLMTLGAVGNILEADTATRASFDRAILIAQKILAGLGARLVTSIEFSKRLDDTGTDQRLLYSFLPKLPHSMGAFSEAQLRFINGHFPEDFAAACRVALAGIDTGSC